MLFGEAFNFSISNLGEDQSKEQPNSRRHEWEKSCYDNAPMESFFNSFKRECIGDQSLIKYWKLLLTEFWVHLLQFRLVTSVLGLSHSKFRKIFRSSREIKILDAICKLSPC